MRTLIGAICLVVFNEFIIYYLVLLEVMFIVVDGIHKIDKSDILYLSVPMAGERALGKWTGTG